MSTVAYADLEELDSNLALAAASFLLGFEPVRSGSETNYRLAGAGAIEGLELNFIGAGFAFDDEGFPTTGRAASAEISQHGALLALIGDIDAPAARLKALHGPDQLFEILGTMEVRTGSGGGGCPGRMRPDALRQDADDDGGRLRTVRPRSPGAAGFRRWRSGLRQRRGPGL